jgi:hypothetical protein
VRAENSCARNDLLKTVSLYTVMDSGDTIDFSIAPEKAPAFAFEHDREKAVYRLKWPDGEVEVFRDRPTRYLVLEPDRESGELRPAIKRGQPMYLYLSREEREVP